MSKETLEWLNRNMLRGFTAKRGHAWHYSAARQGAESNHYDGPIPVADLHRRLFGWRAVPRPLYVETASGLTVVESQVAWVRDDTDELLGIHGPGYTGHQYGEWIVRKVEILLDQYLAVGSAGLLQRGAIAWVQVELPENIQAVEGIEIRPFLMATTSFDGSIATTYKTGYTDVVCDNTRDALLLEDTEAYRVKHTRNGTFDVKDARKALGMIESATDTFMAEIEALCATRVTDAEWSKFLEAHVPIDDDTTGRSRTMATNKREALTQLWNNDVRVTPWRNTAWGVTQATNTYAHHMGIVRGANRPERNMMRAVQGKVGTMDREVLDTLESVIGRKVVAAAQKRTLMVA